MAQGFLTYKQILLFFFRLTFSFTYLQSRFSINDGFVKLTADSKIPVVLHG